MRRSAPTPLRPRWWSVVHVVGSVALAVGTFLPWLHSGARPLSIYELRDAAHNLELLDDSWVLVPIVFVPLVVALGLLARWAGRIRLAHAIALVAAGYTALGALLVRRSPFAPGSGTTLVLVAAGLLLIAAVGELLWPRRAGSGEVDGNGVGGSRDTSRQTPF